MKSLELKKQILIGIISFVFGGFLVSVYQSFIERSKPQISVKDIAFDNTSEELIAIDNYYIFNSDKLISFDNYMNYSDILANEKRLGNLIMVLKHINIKLTKWIDENSARLNGEIFIADLSTFPIFDNKEYSKIFYYSIKNINLTEIPYSKNELASLPEVVRVSVASTSIDQDRFNLTALINNKERVIYGLYPLTNIDLALIDNLANSIMKSNLENLLFFSNACLNDINKRLIIYQEMLDKVQEALIKNSRIKLKITLYNKGKSPVVVQPFFKLQVFNNKDINEEYLLSTNLWSDMEDNPMINNMMNIFEPLQEMMYQEMLPDHDNIENYNYQSFFQDRKISPHLSIYGGSTYTFILETKNTLSDNGINIRKWYESGALYCKITGLTVNNKEIESSEILFSETIQNETRVNLGL